MVGAGSGRPSPLRPPESTTMTPRRAKAARSQVGFWSHASLLETAERATDPGTCFDGSLSIASGHFPEMAHVLVGAEPEEANNGFASQLSPARDQRYRRRLPSFTETKVQYHSVRALLADIHDRTHQ